MRRTFVGSDMCICNWFFFFQAEDGIRDAQESRGLGDVYKRQVPAVPGVIGAEQSALSDCFQGDMLSAPIDTRPAEYKGWKVPEILLSGNEAKIKNWEMEQAMERTQRLRPDLLEK